MKNNLIKSPLRYPGGKSKLLKEIVKYIPSDFDEFREPFFGGGSVSFYLVNKYPNKAYKASDINFDLFCFWKTLKETPVSLYQEVIKIYQNYTNKDGKELYKFIMSQSKINLDCFYRAVYFFILNRITYSGLTYSGGFSEYAFKNRFTKSAIDRLLKAHKVIQHIDIIHSDFEILATQNGKNVFIYLDPPYYSKAKSRLYGRNGDLHTKFDHYRLYKVLKSINHRWLLSYDNNDFIKKLYSDFHIKVINTTYGTGKNKKQTELLIANYDLDRVYNLHK